MYKSACLACLFLIFVANLSYGQGSLKKRLGSARRGNSSGNSDSDSRNVRNDFEGTIWEFKVIDRNERDKSKQTRMTGRFRVKQTAVFAVGQVQVVSDPADNNSNFDANRLIKQFDKDGNKQLNSAELTELLNSMQGGNTSIRGSRSVPSSNRKPNNTQGDLKELLSQRINKAKQSDVGGSARIGDLSVKGSKGYVFQFDQDDNHPLSGKADLRKDRKNKGGVWFGDYDEYVDGKRVKTWRMELRKIDD